uniref:Uncharacterized protein n=1 Tax=Rhizophagus irregularis (strain DAOM 181602 / DAOM 197198 / MUCL 43194) TaxID=747089 RepID=U9U8M2_RHIID
MKEFERGWYQEPKKNLQLLKLEIVSQKISTSHETIETYNVTGVLSKLMIVCIDSMLGLGLVRIRVLCMYGKNLFGRKKPIGLIAFTAMDKQKNDMIVVTETNFDIKKIDVKPHLMTLPGLIDNVFNPDDQNTNPTFTILTNRNPDMALISF